MSEGRPSEETEPVVLIVEDDSFLASLYEKFLESACRVRVAVTGDEALELIDHSLDIAFLDRKLGEWSGDELVNVIHERGVDCGIVMVTAIDPDLDIVDLPVDDYLTKPIYEDELQHAVEEILYRQVGGADKRELLSLVSRKIVLENQFYPDQLENEPKYSKLIRRIGIAEERLALTAEHHASKHRPPECPNCSLRWDVHVRGIVGYVHIGSRVWKCTQCGHVENLPDPSDRFVARR